MMKVGKLLCIDIYGYFSGDAKNELDDSILIAWEDE